MFKRKVSRNGTLLPHAKDNNHVVGYVLKADIRHYFDFVDHDVLLHVIERRICDKNILWLIKKILESHVSKTPRKGMPIGNLTSQFFANVYLNELDYFIKHRLRAKYYSRYVDDFVILGTSKKQLEWYKSKIISFLTSLKLELHPEKSTVMPLSSGVPFLGFRIFYQYKLLKKSNQRRIKYWLQELIGMYHGGLLSDDELFAHTEGWNAYAMHANTYTFRRSIMRKFHQSVKAQSCKNPLRRSHPASVGV